MRRLRDLPAWLRDTLLRMLPHAARPGLYPLGRPGPDSPVLCTGNFTLTVRRLRDALAGFDAWLLVANSRGINVWCAAGGGHLTHHDVIAALRSSGIAQRVDHRTLVLPQLAATGVERRRIREATGWDPVWGPARLEDLPAFLERGLRIRRGERSMRFPLWERLEIALSWALPIALVAGMVLAPVLDVTVATVAMAVLAASVLGLFAALPWFPVTGRARWLTYGGFAAMGFALGALALLRLGHRGAGGLAGLGIACVGAMAVLSLDLAGTTPWYPSTINSIGNRFEIELDEPRCTGAAECVLVCPRDVLQMAGRRHKVTIARPEQCIRCGACIVQCPEDALHFRFDDGRVVGPETIRKTRLNLLGRRSIRLPGTEDPPADSV